jgi:DNA-directed RNA polymerase specialized sigma24 family protein
MTGAQLISVWDKHKSSEDLLIEAVRQYPLGLTKDEDVAQETSIRVWRNLHRYDPSKGNFAGWVRTISLRERDRYKRMVDRNTDAVPEIS